MFGGNVFGLFLASSLTQARKYIISEKTACGLVIVLTYKSGHPQEGRPKTTETAVENIPKLMQRFTKKLYQLILINVIHSDSIWGDS